MKSRMIARSAAALMLTGLLSACGGGGGGEDSTAVSGTTPAPAEVGNPGSAPATPVAAAPPATAVGGNSQGATTTPGAATEVPYGLALRGRILAALTGSSTVICEAAPGAVTPVRLDGEALQVGSTRFLLTSLRSLVLGRMANLSPQPVHVVGRGLVLQALFEAAGGRRVVQLTFDDGGRLAELFVGTPDEAAPDIRASGWLSFGNRPVDAHCLPSTQQAWNPGSATAAAAERYAQLSERAADYPSRVLDCQTLPGFAPEQWQATVSMAGGELRSSPRASRPADEAYRYAFSDYASAYTRSLEDGRVGHYATHPGIALWRGFGLLLGADGQISAFGAFERQAGAPGNQLCGAG